MWREVSSDNYENISEDIRIGIYEAGEMGGSGRMRMSRISEDSIIAQFGQFVVYDVTKTNFVENTYPRALPILDGNNSIKNFLFIYYIF
ncbi:MAG: hypothetical protein AMQ74_00545 [Candidatus Methanofastidiosum methylothiophilum]|uniref:Uncharacterized protein n=1 Tax=Candidatus Methanofastidiosum methylothiophilum TaxID=1705564 RepID=A0A150J6U6_9EURY|nr:MAG: hypothetical protein AMQ74_00545 [Candidatus Methanofastidiosum methylthiophilus]NMC76410.1 hypothetical protein [Candidatus Methanofastidiosa archaeon]